MSNCRELRQGDEYYCPTCSKRWATDEEEPPCAWQSELAKAVYAATNSKRKIRGIRQ